MPDAAVTHLGVRGKRPAPGAIGGARAQPDLRPEPLASFRDAAFEPNPPAGDDRDALAQPLGMGDDMGRKDDGRALRRFLADQMLQTSLVDRVERSEEHTSELQSLMRTSYAVFCLKNKM